MGAIFHCVLMIALVIAAPAQGSSHQESDCGGRVVDSERRPGPGHRTKRALDGSRRRRPWRSTRGGRSVVAPL